MNEPLDLRLLQTFEAVARLGSVTAAARELGRSQPAISHRIAALEEELGVPLFEHVGRGLILSGHGRRLQGRAIDLLAMSRNVRADILRSDEIAGRVTIATLPTVVAHLVRPGIAALLGRYPDLHLSFLTGFTEVLVDHVRSGRADLGLVVGDAGEGLERQRVGRTRIVAAMSPGLAPRAAGGVSVAELAGHRLLAWVGPPDPTFDAVMRYAKEQGLLTPSAVRLPHIETLRRLAAEGAGVALLPDYVCTTEAERGEVVLLTPEGLDLELSAWVLWRSTAPEIAVVDAVRNALVARG